MNGEKIFKIVANNFHWVDHSQHHSEKLCLYGDATLKLKDAITLTENHEITNMG